MRAPETGKSKAVSYPESQREHGPADMLAKFVKFSQISHIIFNNIDPYGQKTNPHSTSWLTGIIHNSVLLILTFHFWLWDLINFISFRERNSIASCYIVIFNLKWTSTIDSIKIFCLRKFPLKRMPAVKTFNNQVDNVIWSHRPKQIQFLRLLVCFAMYP